MKGKEWGTKALELFGKYKYVLLVALVGVLLLVWPAGNDKAGLADGTVPALPDDDLFQVEVLEEKLEKALSQVEGAGEVTVVLTLRESPRQVIAQDGSATERDSQITRETSTVLVPKGNSTQETVKLQEVGPTYQGALVVAQGAGDPQVRLALNEAVSALTGLGTDKISICKGK